MEKRDGGVWIRVKASTVPASLAGALMLQMDDDPDTPVFLSAIGAGAVNQAVKAVIIADGFARSRGLYLRAMPRFSKEVIGSGELRTSIVFPIEKEWLARS